MDLKKLFTVLVVGSSVIGAAAACGGGSDVDDSGQGQETSNLERLPDGGVADGGSTSGTGTPSKGGGVPGW